MEKYSKFIDDCTKLIGRGIAGAANVKQDVEAGIKRALEGYFKSMDFVTRDELNAVKELALKALAENSDMRSQLGLASTKKIPARQVKPGKRTKK